MSIAKSSAVASISPSVPSITDLRRQVDALDRQIVELLSRRTTLVKQIMNQIDEDEPDKDREAQVLSNWLEEGFEYGMDEAMLEKVCKSVMDLGRKSREI